MCSGLIGLLIGHRFKEIVTTAKQTADGTRNWTYVVCCTRCGKVISFPEDKKEENQQVGGQPDA